MIFPLSSLHLLLMFGGAVLREPGTPIRIVGEGMGWTSPTVRRTAARLLLQGGFCGLKPRTRWFGQDPYVGDIDPIWPLPALRALDRALRDGDTDHASVLLKSLPYYGTTLSALAEVGSVPDTADGIAGFGDTHYEEGASRTGTRVALGHAIALGQAYLDGDVIRDGSRDLADLDAAFGEAFRETSVEGHAETSDLLASLCRTHRVSPVRAIKAISRHRAAGNLRGWDFDAAGSGYDRVARTFKGGLYDIGLLRVAVDRLDIDGRGVDLVRRAGTRPRVQASRGRPRSAANARGSARRPALDVALPSMPLPHLLAFAARILAEPGIAASKAGVDLGWSPAGDLAPRCASLLAAWQLARDDGEGLVPTPSLAKLRDALDGGRLDDAADVIAQGAAAFRALRNAIDVEGAGVADRHSRRSLMMRAFGRVVDERGMMMLVGHLILLGTAWMDGGVVRGSEDVGGRDALGDLELFEEAMRSCVASNGGCEVPVRSLLASLGGAGLGPWRSRDLILGLAKRGRLSDYAFSPGPLAPCDRPGIVLAGTMREPRLGIVVPGRLRIGTLEVSTVRHAIGAGGIGADAAAALLFGRDEETVAFDHAA